MKDDDIWSNVNSDLTYQEIFFKAILLDKVKIVPKLDRKSKLYYQIIIEKIGEYE